MSVESRSAQEPMRAGAEPPIPGRIGAAFGLLIGGVCYLAGLAAFLYFAWFVEGLGAPKSIDVGPAAPFWTAVALDVALLLLFGVVHSVMARPGFKAWWTRVIPSSVERSVYVAQAGLLLGLLCWQWLPVPAVIWRVNNTVVAGALIGLSLVGWLIVFTSTFLLNHFDFLGLRQVYLAWRHKAYTSLPFRTPLYYKLVRHPLMVGFLIAFWATPLMTAGHLLVALVLSAYILVSVRYLEERDLVAYLGDEYIAYQRTTPMYIPFTRWRSRTPAAEREQSPNAS